MTDRSTDTDRPGSEPDTRYVLRLLVVKVEGVLVDPPGEWSLPDVEDPGTIDPDELFPAWCESVDRSEASLRSDLEQFARAGSLTVDSDLRDLLDSTKNHTPVRVAFLSPGPREWVRALEASLDLADLRDLTFCYDNYRHGTRRTLLQFLMNRFIAGKGRTLLLGRTLNDERLAEREKTRFRSLEPAPASAIHTDNWNWTPDRLKTFIKEKQPEE